MRNLLRYLPVALFILVSACFVTFQITYRETDSRWRDRVSDMLVTEGTQTNEGLSALTKVVGENYLYEAKGDVMSEGAMTGLVKALPDNFSMYMNEKEYQNFLAFRNSNTSTGIGVSTLYDSSKDGMYVVNVYKGSPAELSGIVPGDVITHIGGVDVDDMGFYSVMLELGGGKTDTQVVVSVRKTNGTSISTAITRGVVNAENIVGEKLGSGIGLIKIYGFGNNDEELFKTTLQKLITSGCEKFVLDVRNNYGGNMETITRILDFLLSEGTVYTVTEKSGATNTITSDTNSVPYPLAVLVNKGTVCGAEVFAASLKDFDAAEIIGTTTYGKASSQSIFALPAGDAVSLSTTMYIPPSGINFDGTGVLPDTVVTLSEEKTMNFTTLTKEEDDQLQAAVEYLKTRDVTQNKD